MVKVTEEIVDTDSSSGDTTELIVEGVEAGEEEEVPMASVVIEAPEPAKSKDVILKSIFEDDKVKQTFTDGKPRWECLWCKMSFATHNATKCLNHLTKTTNNDIGVCRATIDPAYKKKYAEFQNRLRSRKKRRESASSEYDRQSEASQLSAAREMESNKKTRVSKQMNVIETNTTGSSVASSIGPSPPSIYRPSSGGMGPPTNKNIFQSRLTTESPNPTAETQLVIAIGSMIYSLGLPFSFADEPQFRRVLKLAKAAPTTVKLPNRNYVRTGLLELNYNNYIRQIKKELLDDAETFGLCLYGDGATIRRMPLLNIIAAGITNHCAVLELVDCSKRMATGGKKDAVYIASKFKVHLEELDPEQKIIDLLYFDGASNVQKAGRILEASYPRITTLHGSEHVVSLLCKDVGNCREVKPIISVARLAYKYFGSGSHHSLYAIFQKHSSHFNNNRSIGLIRASDTRFAGHFIAIQRMARLKNALIATCASKEFIDLKKGQQFARLMSDTQFWIRVEMLVVMMTPVLHLLRLCDKKTPQMDKLYFYVRRTTITFGKYANDFAALMNNKNTNTDSTIRDSDDNVAAHSPSRRTAGRVDTTHLIEKVIEGCKKDFPSKKGNKPTATATRGRPKRAQEEIASDHEGDDDVTVASDIEEEDPDDALVTTNLNGKPYSFSLQVKESLNQRFSLLKHPYAKASWLLSPVPDIMVDVKKNRNGIDHNIVVENLIEKLFKHEVAGDDEDIDIGQMKNDFWTEFHEFSNKKGPSFGKHHIWQSKDIDTGNIAMWHYKNSVPYTKVLGRLACIVTSKILGTGSAERHWGDVKSLKDGQRSHLSAKTVVMQSTLYGAECTRRANRKEQGEDAKPEPWQYWEDKDFHLPEDGTISSSQRKKAPVRHVRCWLEEWEKTAIYKKDAVNEQRLITKYSGLVWYDLDFKDDPKGRILHSDPDSIVWEKVNRKKGITEAQYIVIGKAENYDPTNESTWEPFFITGDALHDCLVAYYLDDKKDPNIVALKKDAVVTE